MLITQGEMISLARKKAKLRQEDVGRKMGATGKDQAINLLKQIENGYKKVSGKDLKKLAEILGVDARFLDFQDLDSGPGGINTVLSFFVGMEERVKLWEMLIGQIENSPHYNRVLMLDVLSFFKDFWGLKQVHAGLDEIVETQDAKQPKQKRLRNTK